MNKKAGFDFQSYLIGLVLVMGIIVTFAMFYKDIADSYSIDTTTTQEFSDTYDKITDMAVITNNLQNSSETANLGTQAGYSTFYGSMIGLTKIIGSIYSIPMSIINGISATIGIPPMWTIIAGMVIVIMVVTTVLFMIFQSRGN